MPQLIYNGRFDSKTMPITAESLIEHCIEQKSPEAMLLIVPTGRIVQKLTRDFISGYFAKHSQPCQKPKIMTLQKFAETCYYGIAGSDSGRLISNAYLYSLMEEAIDKSELEFFTNKSQNLSYNLIKRISDIILGIKEDGIMPEHLQDDLSRYVPQKRIDSNIGGIKDPRRLKDIAAIYKTYQDLLGQKFLDAPQVYLNIKNKLLKEADNADESQLFPTRSVDENFPIDTIIEGNPIVLFYGFSEFKIPEIEFLAHFAKSRLPIAINLDYTEFNGPLFGNLRDTAGLLIRQGFNNKTILEDDFFSVPNPENDVKLLPSQYLRRWLFNTEKEIRNEHLENSIKIIAAESIVDEVKSIAKLVHHKIKIDGIRQQDICICMRTPNRYTPLFREIFTLNNIPCYITDRYNLSNSQLVTAILSIFDVVIVAYRKPNLIKMIQSVYLKKWNDKPIDVSNFASIAQKLRIFGGVRRGGKKTWLDVLSSRVEFLESKLLQASEYSDDESEIARIKSDKESTEKALSDFNNISDFIAFENNSYTPSEINRLIKVEVLAKFKIKDTVVEFYNDIKKHKDKISKIEYNRLIEEIEKDVAALNKFIDLVDEMTAIAEERDKDKKTKLETFIHKLKVAVTNEKYQLKERTDKGVKITSIEQTRGIPFKVLILCGATDGEFPLNYRTETMLGKILPKSESRHKEAEKIAFYQFLTNNPEMLDSGQQEIYISYPKFNNNEEIIVSGFINALYKVSTLNLSDEPSPSYYPKLYDLTEIREAKSKNAVSEKLQLQLNDIPWIDYITERSDAIKYYSKGLIDKELIEVDELQENFNFIDSIEKYIDSINQQENLNFDVLTEAAIKYLTDYQNRAFSISEIEGFAVCPYKYFSQRILRIGERKAETAEITPLEKGDLLHTIVYKFYTELQNGAANSGKPQLVRLIPEDVMKYREMLFRITEQELENMKFSHLFYELEKISIIGSSKRKGILEYWLETEIERISDSTNIFYPALFEYSFGMDFSKSGRPQSEAVTLENGVKIKGKIDRVEFDEKFEYFKIADYKTSSSSLPKISAIYKGEKFQIPIYLAAAMISLSQKYQLEGILPAGGIYYTFVPDVKDDKITNHYQFLTIIDLLPEKERTAKKSNKISQDYNDLKSMIDQSIEHFKAKIEDISAGKFGKKPAQHCKNCSYYSLCRFADSKTILQNETEEINEEN